MISRRCWRRTGRLSRTPVDPSFGRASVDWLARVWVNARVVGGSVTHIQSSGGIRRGRRGRYSYVEARLVLVIIGYPVTVLSGGAPGAVPSMDLSNGGHCACRSWRGRVYHRGSDCTCVLAFTGKRHRHQDYQGHDARSHFIRLLAISNGCRQLLKECVSSWQLKRYSRL